MDASRSEPSATPRMSPLILSDTLLTLAQRADHAGYPRSARRLVHLAIAVLDEGPPGDCGPEPAAA